MPLEPAASIGNRMSCLCGYETDVYTAYGGGGKPRGRVAKETF